MDFAIRRRPRRNRPQVEALEARALLANAGALDPTFGGGRGFVANPITSTSLKLYPGTQEVSAVAVQPDGKILVANAENNPGVSSYFVLERLDADGSLDAGFGHGGMVLTQVAPDSSGQFGALLVQPDGKIVEVGYSDKDSPASGGGNPSFVVIRLNADGTPDSTFGNDGVAVNPNSIPGTVLGNPGSIVSAQLEADGSIILVGSGFTTAGLPADFVSKLQSDGALDPTFGTDGTAIVAFSTSPGLPKSANVVGLAIQSDGKIVVAGNTIGSLANANSSTGELIRLNADGTRDTSFGGATGGEVDFSGMTFNSLTQQPDGKLLLGEGTSGLLRLNADASPDTTFGVGGLTVLPYPSSGGDQIALQANGQIVVAGDFRVFSPPSPAGSVPSAFGSIRVNANGSLDTSYGNSSVLGLALYRFGTPYVAAFAMAAAIDPTDGNIVVAGNADAALPQGGSSLEVGVARVLATPSAGVGATPASPTAPASFDGSSLTDLAVYEPISGEFAFRPQSDLLAPDQFIPFGPAGAGQTIPAAADYQGIGLDQIAAYLPASGIYAVRPGNGPDQYYSIGIKGAGQTIPAPADYFRTGQADVAVYTPSNATFTIVSPSNPSSVATIAFGAREPACRSRRRPTTSAPARPTSPSI